MIFSICIQFHDFRKCLEIVRLYRAIEMCLVLECRSGVQEKKHFIRFSIPVYSLTLWKHLQHYLFKEEIYQNHLNLVWSNIVTSYENLWVSKLQILIKFSEYWLKLLHINKQLFISWVSSQNCTISQITVGLYFTASSLYLQFAS